MALLTVVLTPRLSEGEAGNLQRKALGWAPRGSAESRCGHASHFKLVLSESDEWEISFREGIGDAALVNTD